MAVTTNYSWNLPTVGGNQDPWGDLLNANWTALDTLLGGVNATELAILDGATVTTAELNKLDGFTGTAADLNYAASLNATGVTAAEFDKLDGLTASTAELNILDGVTATAAEINKLDGFTGSAADLNYAASLRATGVSSTEYNYLNNVTSDIQTQLNTKAPTSNPTFSGSVNAGDRIVLGSWEIWDSGGTLYFKYGTNNVFKIDSSGNITAEANVTAYGSV